MTPPLDRNFLSLLCILLGLGLASIIHHHEGPMVHIRLDNSIIKSMSIQVFGIKSHVGGGHCHLFLCSITYQLLHISKVHLTWNGLVFLIVGNYFHFSMLEDTHTRVSGAEINANCRYLRHGCFCVCVACK